MQKKGLKMTTEKICETEKKMIICAGEGEGEGTCTVYRGKDSPRAIKSRLTKEYCGGTRWACMYRYSHVSQDNENEFVYYEIDHDFKISNPQTFTTNEINDIN